MITYIVRLMKQGQVYYAEWDVLNKKLVSPVYSYPDFSSYYHNTHKNSGKDEFKERMSRVHSKGISAIHLPNASYVLHNNKAGANGEHINERELVKRYLATIPLPEYYEK